MQVETLDRLYGTLSEALGRVGEEEATLFLATLALALIAHADDAPAVAEAIARAERLVRRDIASDQGR